MAKIIEFYIPSTFQQNGKWIATENRGKIIEFPTVSKKTARSTATASLRMTD